MNRNRITGAAREMGGRLRSVAEQVGGDAAARAEGAYDDALDTGVRVLARARENTAQFADDALETGQQLYGRGMRVLTRQAGAHPLAVIVAAGVVGAAIAMMMSSSRRR